MLKILKYGFACALLMVSCKEANKDQALNTEEPVEEVQTPNIIYIMADDLTTQLVLMVAFTKIWHQHQI